MPRISDTRRFGHHGSNRDVDTAAEQLTTTSSVALQGVLIRADTSNTGVVYVGFSSSVTAGTTDATDGMPLLAGESLEVEIRDPSTIYVIASANNQIVYWMAV